MEIQTVLIADPCEEVVLALSQLLQPDFRVLTCRDGDEALALVKQEQPELMILELSLTRMDGITLLRELNLLETRPRTLIFSAALSDYVLCALQELNADYIMRKPTPAAMVAQHARELLQSRYSQLQDWWVSDLLIRLHIPEPSQGFRHLMVALPLLAETPGQFLGKALYLEVARRNCVSFESVEKAIRDAIHTGWAQGDPGIWRRYFPDAQRAPKNKQFLTRIAALLCRHRRCG